jgi:hypothetical protein
MSKQSTGFFKRWQTRYFSLAGHYLSYYQNEKKAGSVKGTIDLEEFKDAKLTSESGAWELHNKGQLIKMKCTTKALAEEWIAAIQAVAGASTSPTTSPTSATSPVPYRGTGADADTNADVTAGTTGTGTTEDKDSKHLPRLLSRTARRINGNLYLLQCFCNDNVDEKSADAVLQVRGLHVGASGGSMAIALQWDFDAAALAQHMQNGANAAKQGLTEVPTGLLAGLDEKDAIAISATPSPM